MQRFCPGRGALQLAVFERAFRGLDEEAFRRGAQAAAFAGQPAGNGLAA